MALLCANPNKKFRNSSDKSSGNRQPEGRECRSTFMRLLVIEDEVKVAHALKKGLENERYEVVVATTGCSAADATQASCCTPASSVTTDKTPSAHAGESHETVLLTLASVPLN